MNQDWEEQKIKALFHELKPEDERLAPAFASDWEAAHSRLGTARHPRRVVRLVAATALLALLVGALFILFRQPAKPPGLTGRRGETPPAPPATPSPSPMVPRPPSPEAVRPQVVRRRRWPVRAPQPALLISQWQPPTDFLLTWPGAQWLKTVPQLGESSVDVKAIRPEEKN